MVKQKEPQTAVCWRVKESNLEWLRQVAQQQERPVTWVVNKMLEQAKEAQHAKAAA